MAAETTRNAGIRPAEAVELRTEDGVRIAARHLPRSGRPGDRDLGVVIAHGFTGSIDKPGLRRIMEAMSQHAGVLAFDFRGHGRSGGRSTVGDREVLDLAAAVQHARDLGYRDVVTCGWSMGGSVVIRHGGLRGGVQAVVSVSAVSRWFYRDTKPMRRVHFAIETRLGRMIARHALGTRISPDGWDRTAMPESPVEVVGRISPIPLLVVHGEADHYFPADHGRAIYDAAREPKELWILPDFAHAESGATPELLDRIGAHLPVLVARGR